MTVIERNFFRLLRAGINGQPEDVEPLSPWKWRRLYQYAVMLGVNDYIWQGLETCRDNFYVTLVSPQLKDKWNKQVVRDSESEEQATASLTNPLLDRKLQAIIDRESSKEETPTRLLLLNIVEHARCILNEGISLSLLVEQHQMLKEAANKPDFIDYDKLAQWISQLHMQLMADLQGTLLCLLMKWKQEKVPFMKKTLDKTALQLVEELFSDSQLSTDEWYFTQKDDQIFVRTHNSQAMMWHVSHSARFSGLYPSEAITNFFRSFANSLTHIEE